MDPEIKEQWRWKFYRLALHLNGVILCIALTLMAFLKAPDPFRIPAVVILIILDILLSYSFYRSYYITKAWLDKHGNPGPEKKDPQLQDPL